MANRSLSDFFALTLAARAALLVAMSAFIFAIYWPGMYGPLVFDDIANIVDNSYLKLHSLDFSSLKNAAFSSESGPLNRPVPMLTFAFNIYFNNGSIVAFPFKFTNVSIHAINGLLVYWLSLLGLRRLVTTDPRLFSLSPNQIFFLASGTALLWSVHPIQLTSVLYIVQRMTSLSATFVLLALISYILGRNTILAGKRNLGFFAIFCGPIIFGTLGLFSKENAALLPLYIVLLEFTLFRSEVPVALWDSLSKQTRFLLIGGIVFSVLAISAYLIVHFLPGYSGRMFSFTERVLSQPRILLFYLFLILLPQAHKFGVFHDDIQLSSSLVNPWTTLPSILFVWFLLGSALFLYKKHKLLTFGILWFFISHLMESTIIALEPAHEHRNYLAVFGPVVALMYLSFLAVNASGRKHIWGLPILFLVLFSANTSLRAWHWSDLASLHDYESRNHPESARAQASLGSMFAKAGQLDEAKEAFLRASKLRSHEVADLINVRIILAWQRHSPPEELGNEILRRARYGLITPLTAQVLNYAVNCSALDCGAVQNDLLVWLPIYISRSGKNSRSGAHFNYLYAQVLLNAGKTDEAILALNKAITSYSSYLHPYFLLAAIYMKIGDTERAEKVVQDLDSANQNNTHPRDKEIRKLSDNIQKIKAQGSTQSRNWTSR